MLICEVADLRWERADCTRAMRKLNKDQLIQFAGDERTA
jgi:hypothetical protein